MRRLGNKPRPYSEFGKLLTEGIRQLGSVRHKPSVQTNEDLAKDLACSVSALYSWRRGEHLPEPDVIAKLARIFVKDWQADQRWINIFLDKGEYGPAQAVISLNNELFGREAELDDLPEGPPPGEIRSRNFWPISITAIIFVVICLIAGVIYLLSQLPWVTTTINITPEAAVKSEKITGLETLIATVTPTLLIPTPTLTNLSTPPPPTDTPALTPIEPNPGAVRDLGIHTFTSGVGPGQETGRQEIPIGKLPAGRYTLTLQNASPEYSGTWLIWDYLALQAGQELVWEIGDSETPDDYSPKAFDEFCDPQTGNNCMAEFTVGATSVGDFVKELNDWSFTTEKVHFEITDQQANSELTLVLSTLFSTHDEIENFQMQISLAGR